MIDVARSMPVGNDAQIEWREESLYQLSLAEGSVDVVFCSQVLQYLTDRGLASSDMRRVLKSGGHIAVSAWSMLSDNPYFGARVDAVAKHLGPDPAAGLRAGSALGNTDDISYLVAESGFKDVGVTTTQIDLDLPRAAPLTVQDAIAQWVSEQLALFADGAGFRIPFCSRVVGAPK